VTRSGGGPLSFPEDEPLPPREERRPAQEPPPEIPPPARPPARYGWLVGIVVAAVLVYIGLNTLRNAGSVSRGVDPGHRLPPFAMPLALSHLDADANVATRPGEGQQGRRAACSVRGPGILNVCQLYDGAPLVLAFVATRAGGCARELDRMERARTRFPAVRLAAVAARTDRSGLRKEIHRRHWRFPIGFDRDGAVFARYGIVDCPTLVFAYPGGIAMRTTVKALGDAQLTAAVRRLVAGSERRGWRPPASGRRTP
jgi:hypothetical protein